MIDSTFDALTRRAAVATLSAAGLTALAVPFSTAGKSRKRKRNKKPKKIGKACRKTCQAQGGPCREAIQEHICPAVPDSCAAMLDCCQFLESCQEPEFTFCFVTNGAAGPNVPV